jgi:uncharacterized membrane protein
MRMSLRTVRERIVQTLCYEAGGLALAAPAYSLVFGGAVTESALFIMMLSVVCMAWAAIHNTLFDLTEFRVFHRLASDRPQAWRVVHAISNDVSSTIVTLPIVMWMGGYGFWAALAVDIGFTVFYAAYTYVFHIAFDWLRPMPHAEVIALSQVQQTAHEPSAGDKRRAA